MTSPKVIVDSSAVSEALVQGAAYVERGSSTDLLAMTAALVSVPSQSLQEQRLADAVMARVAQRTDVEITRIGNSVVASTRFGRAKRVVLGGHLDTVPPNGNEQARLEGETLFGLGTADMKGGLAVMFRILEEVAAHSRFDVTLVWYEAEEVAVVHNGLLAISQQRPELLAGDVAILLEPTDGWVEAGCQGTLRVQAAFRGERAHTARAWMGDNAIHKMAGLLARVADYEPATVNVDGLDYREALQVVKIEGGVAGNVVPDRAVATINRRFAPTQTLTDAVEELRAIIGPVDEFAVDDAAPAAPPQLFSPLVAEFVGTLNLPVRPKLGWTDVARFAELGIPACNYGPGDPSVSHTQGEFVTATSLERCFQALKLFLSTDEIR